MLPLGPRFGEPRGVEALEDSPVALIHGPRRSGKATLARLLGEPLGATYVSFEDHSARAWAVADPAGLVAGLQPRVTVDEMQRVPALSSFSTPCSARASGSDIPGGSVGSWHEGPLASFHYRDKDGAEVDLSRSAGHGGWPAWR